MNPVQTFSEAANLATQAVFSSAKPAGEFQDRIQSLIEAQLLKVDTVDGAGGFTLQSINGPQLYVPANVSSMPEQQRVVWQLRAFLDAVETAT